MDERATDLYGRGWAFPPRFSQADGVEMVAGREDIRQSLRILFSTQRGERIMRRQFGCDLNQYVFENIRENLLAEIATSIADSLLQDEPRIEADAIEAVRDEQQRSLLKIRVDYHIRGTDVRDQLNGVLDIGDGQRSRYV